MFLLLPALLPLGAFVLLFIAIAAVDAGHLPLRRSVISASLLWGLALIGLTELLSALSALNATGTTIAWACLDVVLALFIVQRRWAAALSGRFSWPSRAELGLLAAAAAIVAITGLVAVIAPPNNWDAMSYHMARVAHWADAGNVNFYAAHYLPQLYQPPWAEYAMLNLLLLTHGDSVVNLVQWSTFVGSAVIASLVAAQIGAGRLGQLIAAVFVLTVPMAILQASSAQNHLVVGYWLLSLASVVLSLRERITWRTIIEIGVCAGLATATKGTGYILAAPLLVWTLAILWRTPSRLAFVRTVACGLVATVPNVGIWARNVVLFGFPLGPAGDTRAYANAVFTPRTFAENAIRDTALQLATPFAAVNKVIAHGVSKLSSLLGLDLNDPLSTWPGTNWHLPAFTTHEDSAGNLLPLVVIVAVAAAVLVRRRGLEIRYLAAIAAAYAAFVAYLRWQPWHSRLELPLFLLAAPLVGVVVARRPRPFAVAVAVILLVGSQPWLLANQSRPLLGDRTILTANRSDLYFVNRPNRKPGYVQSVDAIEEAGCRNVGVHVEPDDPWEYPLWALLQAHGDDVILNDVMVGNASARLELTVPPCMILFVNGGFGVPQRYLGADYEVVVSARPVFLYERVR